MENIKIATICGLCAGCKNAISLAENATKNQNVTLLKEIVHNKNINYKLKQKGVSCAQNLAEINPESTVIIRAHGEPPETYNFLNKNNISYLDGTCKNVKNIHNLVSEFSEKGYKIIIVGKYGKHSGVIHPETLGTIGYCKSTPFLIEDFEDINKLENIKNQKLLLVSQTTFNPTKFNQIKDMIFDICDRNNNEIMMKNTICGAQMAIQKSSLTLAKECDLMIIVGGKNSSNTVELFNNIKSTCPAILIEDIQDYKTQLNLINFEISKNTKVGITAGASTDKQELIDLKQIIESSFNI